MPPPEDKPKRWRLTWRKKVVLALVLVSIPLGLGEAGARWSGQVRNVGPSFSTYDPVYLKRNKPSFTCERIAPEFRMRWTTNSLGFRGPEPAAVPPRGVVLFLGDSFTAGYGVSDGEEFVAKVGAELEDSVINAGVGNSGNGRWVKLLEREAPTYAPKLVVLQVCGNDFYDNRRERLYALGPDGTLSDLPIPPPGWKRRIQALTEAVPGLSYSHLFCLVKQMATTRGARPEPAADDDVVQTTPPPAAERPGRALTLAILDRCVSICGERGWPVLVVETSLTDGDAALVRARLEQRGVALIRTPRKAEHPELFFSVDAHWNAAGHAQIAKLLLPPIEGALAVAPR